MLKQVSIPQWKQILRSNFVDIVKLANFLELTDFQREQLLTSPRFGLSLPIRLAQKMNKRDLEDPLFKQFVPMLKENVPMDDFVDDHVGDCSSRVKQKLLHKYNGRVLIVSTSACAMHCRYCFRQHFDYEVARKGFDEELQWISQDSSIEEVILSGGDPLSLDDRILENLLFRLAEIPHVRKVRFHTRFPIGIPERIDKDFLSLLSRVPLQFWFVIHCNHPRELDSDVLSALKSIQCLGIPVLNQAVLLQGVNDDVDVLKELCALLVNHGIIPYYLHQLDKVRGAAHFEVMEKKGMALIEALSECLPGYAVPKYVRETAGMPGKTLIT